MELKPILTFLSKLKKHNDREWFLANKAEYDEVRALFTEAVTKVHQQLVSIDGSLTHLDPKKMIYRIHRDVRFSKNKLPYKHNLAATFSSAGKSMLAPGYHIQLEPNNESFIGLGFYLPEAETLAKVRQEIDYNGDQLLTITKNPAFKKLFPALWDEDKLKSAPKGYDKNHPHVEWLKLKSFLIVRSFRDEEVSDKNFLKEVSKSFAVGFPFNDFLKNAIS
jgi:uncharacterized protein (TIGR02453 family)